MAQPDVGIHRKRVPLAVRVMLLAVGLNVMAWVGASLGPGVRASWTVVSLLLFFLLGLTIGRWWALWVTCAFGVLHAVPVYLGLLPGYLSTWGEALWWVFGLTVLLTLTGIGVLVRAAIRRRPSRFVA